MSSLSLAEAAALAPAREALITAERTLTFAQLLHRVELAASFLMTQGIAPSAAQPVALVMRPELTTVELFWALVGLARPVLLLHPRAGAEAHEAAIRRTGAVAVDATSWSRASAQQTVRYSLAGVPRHPEEIAVVVPTSGTSGRPKLVALSERSLDASALANWHNLGIGELDRWLVCLPLAHVGGLSILTRCLAARRAAVLLEGEGSLSARLPELAALMARSRTTLLSLVPTVLDALLEQGFEPSAELRAVLLGGASTSLALLERARASGVPVLTSYGLTEACSQVTTRPYAQRFSAMPTSAALPSSGKPVRGVQLRIAEDAVIEVAGPTLCSGYWDEPLARTHDGYFRTKDRGRLTPEGLEVLGRADDLIVTGGENVDPLAVEAVLLGIPGVSAACVFAVEDARWGQLVAAALCCAGASLAPATFAEHCANKLAPHERPRLVAFMAELPHTAGGKLDRAETARRARAELVPVVASK